MDFACLLFCNWFLDNSDIHTSMKVGSPTSGAPSSKSESPSRLRESKFSVNDLDDGYNRFVQIGVCGGNSIFLDCFYHLPIQADSAGAPCQSLISV